MDPTLIGSENGSGKKEALKKTRRGQKACKGNFKNP